MPVSIGPQGHRLTWLAVIAAFLFLIPGLAIGFIVARIYWYFLGALLEGNFSDWLTQGWFSKIALTYFPAVLAGAIAGWLGLWLTSRMLKRANYEVVMYSVAAIVVAFTLVAVIAVGARDGITIQIFEIAANTLGIVVGLYGAYQSLKEQQEII